MAQGMPRIMIVESFGNNAKCLSNHLAGFPLPLELVSEVDGLTALTHLQREAVDLVIVDSCLRGRIDGFELCRALRSSFSDSHLPVILILSGCLSLERSKGISVGADLLLHRPVVKEELLRMVQLLLGWKFNGVANLPFYPTEERPVRRLHSVS